MSGRYFKNFSSDVESGYGDTVYITDSQGRMLRRVYDLKSEIDIRLEKKG